jgi:uncharacterized coiled-coil protein SlyX
MEISMRLYSLLSGILLLGAAPTAWAASPGVVGELEQASSTSPKEKTAFADAAMQEINAAIKEVEALLERANRDKNQDHIECLTRKLTPMKSMRDVTAQSNTAMRQALASNNIDHADQEFRKIAVALAKTREFLAEAKSCVGSTNGEKAKSVSTITQTTADIADGSSLDNDLVTPPELAPPTPY